MLHRICLYNTDSPFELTEGYPVTYTGAVIKGSNAFYCEADFGNILIQKLRSEMATFTQIVIDWKKPARLICSYSCQPSFFARAALGNNVHEFIKGAGELHLKTQQFAALTGSRWSSALMAEKPGRQVLVDVTCGVDFISTFLPRHSSVAGVIESGIAGLPERFPSPPVSVDDNMLESIDALSNIDTTLSTWKNKFHQLMKRYMESLLDELQQQRSIRKQMKESDWQIIQSIKQVIEANPGEHYTIPQISQKSGINEHKLKQLFPKITGFGVDEYRKHLLCTRVAKKLVQQHEEPLKSFYSQAGYTNLPNFLRGFRKQCCCSPGELRQDGWDHEKFAGTAEFENKTDQHEQR